jgi:hypothetical protein
MGRPRRKTPGELARMPHEDRLMYEAAHPPTDDELYEELRREVRAIDAAARGEGGQVDPHDVLANEPPGDWGN